MSPKTPLVLVLLLVPLLLLSLLAAPAGVSRIPPGGSIGPGGTILDASGKPVLLVKSGRTAAGARASASHTGALAGVDDAMSAFLAQNGVLRVTRVEGLEQAGLMIEEHTRLRRLYIEFCI